jgi:hypothetical protein
MTNHASPLPWNVRSRALVFPLPASVTPRQLRALLAAQIGFVHDFTQHQVAENTWMAEVTFENNVAKNAVDECESELQWASGVPEASSSLTSRARLAYCGNICTAATPLHTKAGRGCTIAACSPYICHRG